MCFKAVFQNLPEFCLLHEETIPPKFRHQQLNLILDKLILMSTYWERRKNKQTKKVALSPS